MKSIKIILLISATFISILSYGQSTNAFNFLGEEQTPDLSWTCNVGASTFPKGIEIDASTYGLNNDTTALSTEAIQKAIDKCSINGGGTVNIKAGYYRIGAIFLKSNVNLHLNKGVTLIASEDINQYPEIKSRIAGIEMSWPSAVVNIIDAKNASISGEGTIDCRGKVFWDKYWNMRKDYEKRALRWIVDYDCKRVRGLLVSNSNNITLKDFTIMRSGFWACHILYSDKCTLYKLKINNNIGGYGPSTDGIDIDSSTNILVDNCTVDCNDDNICLKSGRDADGLRVNRPTENVIIRNCTVMRGAGLITCGSETSGGIRNILGYNLKAMNTSAALRFKSALTRGGTVENIYVTKVKACNVKTLLAADLNWNPSYSYSTLPKEFEGKEIPEHWEIMLTAVTPKEKGYPHFKNIWLSNVVAKNISNFISASGWSDELPLQHFHLNKIKAEVDKAGEIKLTEDFVIKNVHLKVKENKEVTLIDNKNAQIDITYEKL